MNSVWIVFSVTIMSGFVTVVSLYIINPICLCSMLSLILIVVRTSTSLEFSQSFCLNIFFVGLFLTLLAFPSPTVVYNNVNQVFHTHLCIHTIMDTLAFLMHTHAFLIHTHTHTQHTHSHNTHTHTHSCTNT